MSISSIPLQMHCEDKILKDDVDEVEEEAVKPAPTHIQLCFSDQLSMDVFVFLVACMQ